MALRRAGAKTTYGNGDMSHEFLDDSFDETDRETERRLASVAARGGGRRTVTQRVFTQWTFAQWKCERDGWAGEQWGRQLCERCL